MKYGGMLSDCEAHYTTSHRDRKLKQHRVKYLWYVFMHSIFTSTEHARLASSTGPVGIPQCLDINKAVHSFSSQRNPCHRRTWFRFNLVLSNENLPNGFSINCQADPSWNDPLCSILWTFPITGCKIWKHCFQNPSFAYFIVNLYCDLK